MRMALLLYMLTGCANRSYRYGRQVALGLYGYLYSASDRRWLPGYIDPAEHPTFRDLKEYYGQGYEKRGSIVLG